MRSFVSKIVLARTVELARVIRFGAVFGMHFRTFLAGALLVAVGIFLAYPGSQLLTVEVPRTVTEVLFPRSIVLVADYYERSGRLDGLARVTGSVQVTSAGTGERSDVSFYVMDNSNYQRWLKRESTQFLYQRVRQGDFNFSFTTDHDDEYHFVFDNSYSPLKKNVTYESQIERVVLGKEPDVRVRYAAMTILGVGAVVAALGFLRRTVVPWA